MNWLYGSPNFESLPMANKYPSAWTGHRSFVYDLISSLKPKVVVELGTYDGTSFFAFCQAVKDRNLPTSLYAVDTWQGDVHASYYGDEIFNSVQATVDAFYSNVSLELIKTTFDSAVTKFADKSIDILHIDGLHTYDAVKHDFETWLPKVSNQGIILFHDVHTRQGDFGVHVFWDEIKKIYPTMEFFHAYGLGVLFFDKSIYEQYAPYEVVWRRYYENLAIQYGLMNEVKNYSQLIRHHQDIQERLLEAQQKTAGENNYLKNEVATMSKALSALNTELNTLKTELSTKQLALDSQFEASQNKQETHYNPERVYELQREIVWMQNSIFWRLRGFYLRVKWALTHPLLFFKKYLRLKRKEALSQMGARASVVMEPRSTTEVFYEICNDLLLFLPKEYPVINQNSSKKSLLIEMRDVPNLEFTIKNTIQKLGDGWGHIIYCSEHNKSSIERIVREISPLIEIRLLDREINSRDDYNELCLSDFWEDIDCEKVLVYQTDTFIFNTFDDDFLEYDYIGAPWPDRHVRHIQTQLQTSLSIKHGNGGLSLRSVAMMRSIIKKYPLLKNVFPDKLAHCPEDLYFVYYAELEGYHVAPYEIAKKFAYEHIPQPHEAVFGCHQPWWHMDHFIRQTKGVNLFGFFNNVFGLGKSGRIVHELLNYCHIPHTLINVHAGHHHYAEYLTPDKAPIYKINIMACNPGEDINPALMEGRYNIGFWYWELQVLPQDWKESAKKYDELWVASEFLYTVFTKELPGKKVVLVKVPFQVPEQRDRLIARKSLAHRFTISETDTVFYFVFDFFSDVYRKNPQGVIQAFQEAFPFGDSYKLIIKSQNGTSEQEESLRKLCKKDSRIMFLNETFTEDEMIDLMNAGDVYVSLHRGEGLGLTIAEALLLEKPVIVTHYSGNLDFSKSPWAGLVSYDLVPIHKESAYQTFFPQGSHHVSWADPHKADAARWMKKIVHELKYYQQQSAKAKPWILQEYSSEKTGKIIADRLQSIYHSL